MSAALEQILESARAAFDARRLELVDRSERLKKAVDTYMEAVEASFARELADKLGVGAPLPASPSGEEAARALRDLVIHLPELRSEPAVPSAPSEEPEPPASSLHERLRDEPSSPTRPALEVYEAGPAAKALWHELKQRELDLETLPVPLFKAVAAELAARARLLQDRNDNAELIPERVIKKLTACAAGRNIRGIHGLARHHEGNWEELANRARALQAQLQKESNGSPGLTQRMTLPSVHALKKKAAIARAESDDDDDDDDGANVDEFPRLRSSTEQKPVILVGGIPKQPKLQRLCERFGFEPEWLETQTAGNNAVRGLEGRILDGRVTAVVVLEGLLGHKHYEPLVAAARQSGTPLAYGDTAGVGALRKAFSEIEKKLEK